MKALVTGATGYVGSRLISALLDAGYTVVATARTPAKLDDFDWAPRVQTLGLDVLDEGSVRTALREAGPVDVAYYLVHALGEGDYESSDQKAATIFADAAGAAGVGRIVYLGGFLPADGKVSPHLNSRAQVGQILRDGPVEAVVLQAAVIFGAGSTSFEIIRHLVDRLPVVPLPSFMGHEVQPIAVDDVLHYLVGAGDRDLLPPGTYDIAGDERLTYAALARVYARVAGRRRVFVPVPFVPERLAALVMGPVLPVPTALVGDLVQSLGASMTTDDHSIRTYVPDPAHGLTSVREAIARALAPATSTRPGDGARTGSADGRVGVDEMEDPMALAETDAEWAGDPDRRA